METINRIGTKHLNILDWEDLSIELLRLDFKKAGVFTYLPRSVVSFLNLDKKQDKSLVAFLDSEGSYNYLIITADKSLAELLKPIILSRRQKAQQLQQEIKLQAQRQQSEAKAVEAEQDAVLVDV